MAKIAKTTPTVVTITKPWQSAFIAAAIASQALWVGMFVWNFTRPHQYINAGTWTWQITTWAYPLLFLGIGYFFASRRVRGTLPRLFWAMFLTVMGYMLYSTGSVAFNWLAPHIFYPHIAPGDTSLWAAFGRDWTEMLVVLLAYTVVLGVLDRRSKRR